MGGWLHVAHWPNAEVIASWVPVDPNASYAVLGWNSDGTLLALDDKASLVWDARTDEVRRSKPAEQFTDVAWSPNDPTVFASLGGKECPRDFRIWRRVK